MFIRLCVLQALLYMYVRYVYAAESNIRRYVNMCLAIKQRNDRIRDAGYRTLYENYLSTDASHGRHDDI